MFKRLIAVILGTILLASSCAAEQSAGSKNGTDKGENATRIKFIIPDSRFYDVWIVDEKQIKDTTPQAIIKELLKYPKIFPEGSKLLNIQVKEYIAYVDMNNEFDSYNLGSSGTNEILYSIVNTLCLNESLGINGVKFLIEGKEVKYIGEFVADSVKKPHIKLSELEYKQ